jgi:RNA polymerase sigma-70 factor (ECF subfamily)
MNDTAIFEQHRAHLLGIAYRMLGEMASAEDIVQETWLRWQRAEQSEINNPRAWLSTATIRLSLDALRSARARRETYVGPWLPEPLVPDDMRTLAADTPAAHAELASDLSLALLHVLERLSPEERAAFILHDAFDCDYAEIAEMLGKNEPACRKLVSRARERVKADRPRYSVSKDQHREMLARFTFAAVSAEPGAFQTLFADDVVFYSDGGGRVPAAINPVRGADRVARLLAGLMSKRADRESTALEVMEINSRPSVVFMVANTIFAVITIEVEDDRITAIYTVRNPEKLARLERAITPPIARGSSASA